MSAVEGGGYGSDGDLSSKGGSCQSIAPRTVTHTLKKREREDVVEGGKKGGKERGREGERERGKERGRLTETGA